MKHTGAKNRRYTDNCWQCVPTRVRFLCFWGDTPGRQFRENSRERARRSPGNRSQRFDSPLGPGRAARGHSRSGRPVGRGHRAGRRGGAGGTAGTALGDGQAAGGRASRAHGARGGRRAAQPVRAQKRRGGAPSPRRAHNGPRGGRGGGARGNGPPGAGGADGARAGPNFAGWAAAGAGKRAAGRGAGAGATGEAGHTRGGPAAKSRIKAFGLCRVSAPGNPASSAYSTLSPFFAYKVAFFRPAGFVS
jgi:hypothetical protein